VASGEYIWLPRSLRSRATIPATLNSNFSVSDGVRYTPSPPRRTNHEPSVMVVPYSRRCMPNANSRHPDAGTVPSSTATDTATGAGCRAQCRLPRPRHGTVDSDVGGAEIEPPQQLGVECHDNGRQRHQYCADRHGEDEADRCENTGGERPGQQIVTSRPPQALRHHAGTGRRESRPVGARTWRI